MKRLTLIALIVTSALCILSYEKHNVKLPSLANTMWEADYTTTSGDNYEKITITDLCAGEFSALSLKKK